MKNTVLAAMQQLPSRVKGEVKTGEVERLMYATDASAYREVPTGVVYPVDGEDIVALVRFANEHGIPLIPRAAGTSLAGQVVGSGLIVDVSRHMNKILEINTEAHWVTVQPGVVLDELNLHLKPLGLFFSPETSTSNRCNIGGMVGNNSCGAHSLVYGSTRDHTLEIKAILSDGSEVVFKELSKSEFDNKMAQQGLESSLYRHIYNVLSDEANRLEIEKEFPEKSIHRRNTGYAIDIMANSELFGGTSKGFNFCSLLAGSEGTLAFITEIKLHLDPLPPAVAGLVCVHLNTVRESLLANLVALRHEPSSVELMDKTIMDLTKENPTQSKNRFFVKGDPGAILIVEFVANDRSAIEIKANQLEQALRSEGLGFHFPVIFGADIPRVWNLRKAGLGVLSNMPGDAKPVPVIEDTAIAPALLPSYIEEFDAILAELKLKCVYYAHIGTGELHLRPVLNLKDPNDVRLFKEVALRTALLVKKYRGSLSGEHGDGRLRGEFIPIMIGAHNYELVKGVKKNWDPNGIFNPGKITETPPMITSLRFEPGVPVKEIETVMDFSHDQGIIRAVERCNGSGDCRKSEIIGGTMCPSFMATRDERNTTRARANILREFLTKSTKTNPFDHQEIYEIMDLCLSCKACKSECPSNVDMAKLKAEFLQHYYDSNGIPLRTRAIAYITSLNQLMALVPTVSNFFLKNRFLSGLIKRILRFAPNRSIPLLHKFTFTKWFKKHDSYKTGNQNKKTVYLFADEFTNYNDTELGIVSVLLLEKLGYHVVIPRLAESGRTFISKGLLRKAKSLAIKNITILSDRISDEIPFIGIEPSAILSFRDEYPDLVPPSMKAEATRIAAHTFSIEEFLTREFAAGAFSQDLFTEESQIIKLHGHCQQKAIASTLPTINFLQIPKNYKVKEIPSGCCGMAGSFGYEREHYDLSMKVGELVLFPAIRSMTDKEIVVAPGTSCRHQIADGTGKKALHPVEVIYKALKE